MAHVQRARGGTDRGAAIGHEIGRVEQPRYSGTSPTVPLKHKLCPPALLVEVVWMPAAFGCLGHARPPGTAAEPNMIHVRSFLKVKSKHKQLKTENVS